MEAASEAKKVPNHLWLVVDLNATKGPRKHEIPTKVTPQGEVIMTRSYILESDKPCAMEQEHAMFFLKDDAFVVMDAAGNHIQPVKARDGGMGGFELGENEVLAQYDELSKEALFKRCKILVGSEHIKETATKKEDMIAFLKGKAKPPVGVSRGSEGLAENFELASKILEAA